MHVQVYFSSELQALISGKVCAVKSMVSIYIYTYNYIRCADDLDTCTYICTCICIQVSAVKSMISVCPEALDAPLPKSLIGVPSLRDFTLLRQVGRGGYGSVWVARKNSSGDIFALKAVRRAVQPRMKRVEDIIFKQVSILSIECLLTD